MSEQTSVVAAQQGDLIEKAVMGDLSRLSPTERMAYYQAVCKSLALNPLTRPFDYITLNGRLTLYARKDATDQLRRNSTVSITKLERDTLGGVYVVTAYASTKDGRTDSSIGAVNIDGLKGDALANAYMKAETKAKRRVTLSICGLGWLDETEVETIQEATPPEPTGIKPLPYNRQNASEWDEPVKPLVNEQKATTQEHWIKNPAIRARWWAWTGNTKALTEAQVHEAIGHEHMEDYPGTMQQAKDLVDAYVKAKSAQAQDGDALDRTIAAIGQLHEKETTA